MTFDVHTPRRSKRFQPLIGDASKDNLSQILWQGTPILVRDARSSDMQEGDEFDASEDAETVFYSAYATRSRGRKAEGIVYRLGDTVLVKTHAKYPSIGVIVSLWEVRCQDEGDVKSSANVKVHWFLRPEEMASVRAKKDHLKHEIYFSLNSTAILTPSYILDHCNVLSCATIQGQKSRDESKTVFYCASAIDARRGLYYEIDWEKHRTEALSSDESVEGDSWIVAVKENLSRLGVRKRKGPKNRIRQDSSDDDEDGDGDSADEYGGSEGDESDTSGPDDSPEGSQRSDDDSDSRKRTRSPKKLRSNDEVSQSTPRTPKRPSKRRLAAPTPHSKAALRARARRSRAVAVHPPVQDLAFGFMKIDNLPDDPWLRALQVLHVGSRPDALPCREEEYGRVLRSVEGLLEEGSGGCVYISGVPGTGKTATVHRIVRDLKHMAERNETNPFTYVEINGLKIPEPAAAYSLLWEAVSGHNVAADGHMKISSKEALKQLTKYFNAGVKAGPGGHACVVLMDELDQLVTTKQEVVYNFFNWPTQVKSKLVVIAVANTMDLPERVMSGRVRSRLGMVRINFQPYSTPQLEKIVQSRLQSAKEGYKGDFPNVLMPDGIKFAAMKVSSISGDARRVLDICRRAVELVHPLGRAARTDDVKNVIKLMQNSPTAAFLADCSLHERIMLASLLKCVKRDGVEEVKWGDIQHQHFIYTNVLTGDGDSNRKPTPADLRLVLDSLLASHAVLLEDGPAATKKPDEDRKVLLNIEQNEVERVLSDMGGQHWKNALGV